VALHALSAGEALAGLARDEFTSRALTEALLARLAALDGRLGAFLTVAGERALAAADAADALRRAARAGGEPLPALLGLPIAVKDVLAVDGLPCTCGSRILENFVAPYTATAVARLEAAGALVLSKANMDEFAMGSSNENSAFFPAHNPWDLARVPGGSSGGSAAAVAARLAPAALGTDTGGSVRQPAALCGVVGLRPSYGRVSRYGLVAFASSLDQIGPLARRVYDAALLLGVMAGHDPADATSVPAPVPDYTAALEPAAVDRSLRGLRIGVPSEYFAGGVQPEVAAAVRAALEVLAGLGAELREVSLPHTSYALPVYYLTASAEASANLARFDGMRYGLRVPSAGLWETYRATRGQGFGPEVKRRIMLGTYALSAGYYDAYYVKAQKVRTLIRRDFEQAFEQVDLIASPTSPTTAFRLGEKTADPMQMYLADIFTLAHPLAGLPAISVPCGFDGAGLPIGLQLAGPAFGEERLLQAAYAYEQATDWHTVEPALSAAAGPKPG
jgi:aspartyl-tRNA(Asn)/glutamyl-tRNA(Gln) amidotransferase subunit A